MRRFLALALVAVVALTFSNNAEAQAASPVTPAFKQFQGRVCHLMLAMNDKAAPVILRFNQYYFDDEPTPANLHSAGQAARQLHAIFVGMNKPLFALRAPANVASLWNRYKQQERHILPLLLQGAEALEAGEKARYEQLEKRNEAGQRRRNATFNRIGIVCE